MTLYGYSREPDPAALDDTVIRVPDARVASEPVPVEAGVAEPDGGGEDEDGAPGPIRGVSLDGTHTPTTPPLNGADPGADPAGVASSGARASAAADAETAAERAAAWAAAVEIDDGPEVAPWDRRPLMVVIAAGAALVLLAVLSGVVASSMFAGPGATTAWQAPPGQGQPSGAPPSGAPGVPGTGETVTLSGVGDVIMGTLPNKLPPNGGVGFFNPVKDALAADLVMGNLETALSDNTGRSKCAPGSTDCFQLYLPPAYASVLKAGGFQLLNLANNHTNDMGPVGLNNTRAALESAGLRHTGAPNEITVVEIKGIKVAVLGFASYSWGQNLNDIPAAAALVRKADEMADLVVIQMQGGDEGADQAHTPDGKEYFNGDPANEPRGDLRKFSRAVIDAGADVVFGHGPHIMRGMEFYKGRLIAYSLGNFCGYGVLSTTGYLAVGGVLKVTLTRDGTWVRGQLVATEMVHGGLPALDSQQRALSFVNGLSKDDFGDGAAQISTTDGTITARSS